MAIAISKARQAFSALPLPASGVLFKKALSGAVHISIGCDPGLCALLGSRSLGPGDFGRVAKASLIAVATGTLVPGTMNPSTTTL